MQWKCPTVSITGSLTTVPHVELNLLYKWLDVCHHIAHESLWKPSSTTSTFCIRPISQSELPDVAEPTALHWNTGAGRESQQDGAEWVPLSHPQSESPSVCQRHLCLWLLYKLYSLFLPQEQVNNFKGYEFIWFHCRKCIRSKHWIMLYDLFFIWSQKTDCFLTEWLSKCYTSCFHAV